MRARGEGQQCAPSAKFIAPVFLVSNLHRVISVPYTEIMPAGEMGMLAPHSPLDAHVLTCDSGFGPRKGTPCSLSLSDAPLAHTSEVRGS